MATFIQRYVHRVPAAIAAAVVVTLLSTVACSRGAERSTELAEESERLWERRKIQEAMLRAVEAYQAAPTNAALRALANAVQNDRQLEVILNGGADATPAVAFSLKGDRLATGGDDGAVRIWDAKSWKLLRTIDADGERVAALAYTPDGNRIYSSDGALVRRWDPATGQESGPPLDAKRGNVEAMAMHPGGRWLVAGYSRGFVVWDLGQQPPHATPLPEDTSQRGSALAFDEDGERLVVVEGGKTLKRGTFSDGVFKVSFEGTLGVETTAVTMMILTIAAGFSNGRVQRFQDYTMFPQREAIVHKAPVRAVALEHHGVYLASGSDDGRVLVTYGWQEPEPFATRDRVLALAWDPTARRLVVAGEGSSLYVLHPTQRQPLARVLRHEAGGIRQISFDARGEVVAGTGEPAFPALQGVPLAKLMDVESSIDGRLLAAGDSAGTIGLWNAQSKQFLRSWKTPKAIADVAFSPDGKRLASADAQRAEVTLIDVGQPGVSTFRGTCPRVTSVAFLGERLVTGCEDGSVELLDLAERKSIVRLPDHDPGYGKHVTALAVRGGSVAAGSQNGRVMLWNLDPQWWMRRACRRANPDAKPCRSLGGPSAELAPEARPARGPQPPVQ
jgi:WD40 repeat protein